MQLISISPRIDLILRRRQVLSLENAEPKIAIECKSGTLWVTVSGDNQDHMISSGQQYVIPARNRKVVVEALGNARLGIAGNN
jgi:hypothetical protein